MSRSFDSSIPSDIGLLLRADAEQHWLQREVLPVLRHLETGDGLEDDEVGAALAYLEAMWDEATSRARETDAAHTRLRARHSGREELSGPADRYHAAVCVLREIVAERVTPLVEAEIASGEGFTSDRDATRVAEAPGGARFPRANGCAPWAA